MGDAESTTLYTFVDGDAAVVVDERHEAVIISTWFGEATHKLIEEYFDWLDVAIAEFVKGGTPHGLINDACDAGRPQPTVRRRMVERGDKTSPEAVRLLVGSYTVISNPLVRGVMTAIGWLRRSEWETTVVASCEEAIERLREAFRIRGLPFSCDLSSYRRPARPGT